MILSEKIWAAIGKLLLTVGTIVGIFVGLFTLADRYSGPHLMAVVESSKYYLDPRTRSTLREKMDISAITEVIDQSKAAGKGPKETLEALVGRLNQKDKRSQLWNDLSWFGRDFYYITVLNESDEVAHGARLILPGTGWAELGEPGVGDSFGDAFEWKREIAIGIVRPGSRLILKVWPNATAYGQLGLALVHSSGSGVVYMSHGLYGPTANAQYWYFSLSTLEKVLMVSVGVLLLVGGLIYAIRRKHIVFSLRGAPRKEA